MMLIFPSLTFHQNYVQPLSQNVAYISPLLAFNVDLHTSCFTSLLRHGKESLASIFDIDECLDKSGRGVKDCIVNLRLEPYPHVPRCASHLRISFLKIPECGTMESLREKSSIEAMDRQEMIDLALQEYFDIDRYLAKDDVFRIQIDWNCNSILCVGCSLRKKNEQGDIIYFKVKFCLLSLLLVSSKLKMQQSRNIQLGLYVVGCCLGSSRGTYSSCQP